MGGPGGPGGPGFVGGVWFGTGFGPCGAGEADWCVTTVKSTDGVGNLRPANKPAAINGLIPNMGLINFRSSSTVVRLPIISNESV